MSLDVARQVLRVEGDAIHRLEELIGVEFLRAVELIGACTGRVVWSGMGKSGIICQKLAATMRSTGTGALFLHPAEAIHGDLGMVEEQDLVITVSNSGATEEILRLAELVRRLGVTLIAISSFPDSPLAEVADLHLDLGVRREACPLNLAPTASTTASLALGDALAMAVSVKKGFREEDFAILHPGGKLGKKFVRIKDLMHSGDRVPRVGIETGMKDVIYEMSRKGIGMTTVQDDNGRLLGVITDGDLRRLMERDPDPLARRADEVMHRGGVTLAGDELASAALKMMEDRRITSLMVSGLDGEVLGVVHLHDLWGIGLF